MQELMNTVGKMKKYLKKHVDFLNAIGYNISIKAIVAKCKGGGSWPTKS